MVMSVRNCGIVATRVRNLGTIVNRISELNTVLGGFGGKPEGGFLWKLLYRLPKKQYIKIIRKSNVKSFMRIFYSTPRGVLGGCPYILLDAGRALLDAGEFAHAAECFNRVIETLNYDNQNIRLSALMGRLESKFAQGAGPAQIKEHQDYRHIVEFLHTTNQKVQTDIKARLAYAEIQTESVCNQR